MIIIEKVLRLCAIRLRRTFKRSINVRPLFLTILNGINVSVVDIAVGVMSGKLNDRPDLILI